MILIDTSIWIDHLRLEEPTVSRLLVTGRALVHPMVIGEIAVGSFKRREVILEELSRLAIAAMATHEEVLRLISAHQLFGVGIGYMDVHLLASVRLTPNASLWTRDKNLRDVAARLNLAAKLSS
jgi:predicted nucleic acid-binding protein